jgi:hypothetical protein
MAKNDTFYADGTVLFDRYDASDISTGLQKITGSNSITTKPNSKMLTDKSKDENQRGMVSAQVAERDAMDFTWTVKGFDRTKMSMQMMGTDTTFSQGGGTATSEPITIGANGIYIKLAYQAITAGSVVAKDSAGIVTYVEGTDYTIDYNEGYIIKKGTTVASAQAIKVSYAYGSISGWDVAGETVAQITGRFIFSGTNIAQKRRFRLEIPYLVLTSDKPFDFLDDKLSEFTFKGTPILQDGESSTHYFRYLN